jgi:hypothetical protein
MTARCPVCNKRARFRACLGDIVSDVAMYFVTCRCGERFTVSLSLIRRVTAGALSAAEVVRLHDLEGRIAALERQNDDLTDQLCRSIR